MRPHAVAPTEPTRGGGQESDREARELTRACVTCTKHEFAIDGLTQALARLRRVAAALRDENVALRAELSHLRQSRSTAPR
jgi:regulator of replication initiation timing